ncbi:flagellar hook-associated protein FlgL [Pseudoxanthomonas sp.]|uniref:flagellar hook-associated protein FlgL n=1 Tax=Pseudoxanthomonas sp. TaxID=1871049 RepID=UPI0026162691|nr:flagellar hook-associated protein FlgL [Pseudoxanthomonas sp.]WDS36846.1 MAG: flagellar hook-associated protein FlgL [Pseudoxanthomonas sp.]
MGNTRISTNGQYQFSLNLMMAKQRELAKTYQQVSTGSKMVTGADDPLGAGRSQQMDRSLARLDQYGDNATQLQSRLNQQESVLAQAGDLLTRVRTLSVQANNASLSDADRKSISNEFNTIYNQLLALSNSDDGSGRYLFGGTQDGNAPFTLSGGKVVYNGDQTQRQVEVASGLRINDTLPGSEVFMRVRTGTGTVDTSVGAANTGTGLLLDFGITNSDTWNGATYNVVFTAPDTYEVRDASGGVLDSGRYSDGDTIAYGGIQMRLEGAPAAGDTFTIAPSGTRDIFSTLKELASTLGTETTTDAQRAAQHNALQSGLRDISTAQQAFVDARAEGGAGQSAIDNANDLNASRTVATKTDLSSIRDLDYAEALSRYSQESTALDAAQRVFAQIQQMSLFKQL